MDENDESKRRSSGDAAQNDESREFVGANASDSRRTDYRTAPVEWRGDDFVMTSFALSQLASRIESANGDAPDLVFAASSLVPEDGSSERDRANAAAQHVIRPLAESMLLLAARSVAGTR